MKRMFTALIASAMLLLAGCSSGNSEPTNVASVDTAASNVGEAASEGSESAAEENAVTLDETVIYDGNDIKITATGIKEDSFFGPELNLLIENNGTQNIVVQPDYCLVNGYMMYGLMSSDVAAGKKNNDTMVFSGSTLKACGIDQIADIRLRLTVIDSDSWMTLFKTDEITLQTSAAGTYTQTYDDSGEVIYDTNGIKVVAKSADDEFLGKGVVFYLENNTDRHVAVNGENISVNGYREGQACLCELPDRASQLSGLPAFDAVWFHLCPPLRRIQFLSGHNTRAADSAERLSLRNGKAMSENLFGLTVAADKGLDDLQCQRLLSENRRYQEVMLQYRCALKALESRLEILNEEFSLQHDRNPIESMKSRLKSPSSIMNKMQKRGLSLDFPTMQANIMDIASVRVICSFEEDVFFLAKC